MKYAIEMGPDAIVYIPGFIKTGSSIQRLREGFTNTQAAC
jgi:hypothetical protein